MKFSLDKHLDVDLQYIFGSKWNVNAEDLQNYEAVISNAAKRVQRIRETGKGPGGKAVLFSRLPYILDENVLMTAEERLRLERLDGIGKEQDVLISIGIGGSYLGNQAIFDIFYGPYWNMRSRRERNGCPQVFFAGQNADPAALMDLVRQLRRERGRCSRKLRVLLLIISKSGTTVEPMAAFHVLRRELSDFCELSFITVTDRNTGKLHELAEREGWEQFAVPEGIGGRFSVFSQVGLVWGKLVGLDIRAFLDGARFVEEHCRGKISDNPALMLAAVKFIAMKEYGVAAEVIMPYGAGLRALGWWYAQLLGESLGKKFDTHGNIIYNGRIPVACVGTTDMHSLTQEHQQGKKNKIVQFISVRNLPDKADFFCDDGHAGGMVDLGMLLNAAARSNQEALAQEERMSCAIEIEKLTEFHIGMLMYFFSLLPPMKVLWRISIHTTSRGWRITRKFSASIYKNI